MAQQASLQVASRTTKGKGAARTLRREGKVPGVIYGHGREAESVAIDTGALHKMLIGPGRSSTSTCTRSGATRRSRSKCRCA